MAINVDIYIGDYYLSLLKSITKIITEHALEYLALWWLFGLGIALWARNPNNNLQKK